MKKKIKKRIPWNKGLRGHQVAWNKGLVGVIKLSAEHKRKISEANKGKKMSKEAIEKIRQAHIGKKYSEESKKKMSESHKGQVAWNKGKKCPQISEGQKGRKPTQATLIKMSLSRIGIKLSEEHKKKIGDAGRGEKNWRWIKDRTKALEKRRLKNTQEWKNWRMAVFERDRYTCMECGASGVYIEPHHIIPIRSDMEKLFNTNNGITLCRPCHQKTIWKESDFEDKYLNIVAAQM